MSIRRHVFAYMLSAVLVLFGVISYKDIGVDRYPTVEFPMISVTTILPGGTPEIIDSSITNLIETSVNSTPGIDHINSNSSPGISVINIRFNMDKDVNVAFNEVSSRVNRVLRDLPDEAEPPVVAMQIPHHPADHAINSASGPSWSTASPRPRSRSP